MLISGRAACIEARAEPVFLKRWCRMRHQPVRMRLDKEDELTSACSSTGQGWDAFRLAGSFVVVVFCARILRPGRKRTPFGDLAVRAVCAGNTFRALLVSTLCTIADRAHSLGSALGRLHAVFLPERPRVNVNGLAVPAHEPQRRGARCVVPRSADRCGVVALCGPFCVVVAMQLQCWDA